MKKLIKKLVLKYLEKYTGKEFTQIDNRIYDIEVKLGIHKPEHDAGSKYVDDMAVKDVEYIKENKQDVSKTELTEFPEKWYIKSTNDNLSILNKWAQERVVEPTGYFYSDKRYSSNILYGYTEISFSDFERLVLKKEEVAKNEDLETGKWYKQGKSFAGVKQYLIYVVKKDDLGVEGYGICDGIWFNNSNSYCSDLIQASKEEVEAALIEEAKKRGFKKGVEFISVLNSASGTIQSDVFYFELKNNRLLSGTGYPCGIFSNGIWSDIIDLPKVVEEIDFNVPGQLLISDQDSMIVLTTGVHNKKNETFQGTTVSTHSSVTHKGEHWKQWSKEGFKIFNGTICLKN